MKRPGTIVALSLAIGGFACSAIAGEIDAGLQDVLETKQDGEIVSTLVYLWDQGDIPELSAELNAQRATRHERSEEVLRTLRDTAELTQGALKNYLADLHAQGKVDRFEFFWIANLARVDAAPKVIEQIAEHPDVQRVYFNPPIESVTPVEGEPENLDDGSTTTEAEPGLQVINAPEAWDYGYTGEGVLVSTLDTGVDGNHPALADRWRGLHPDYEGNPEWAWFDPVTNTNFPQEFAFNSHGTHTMGSAVGGAPGDTIGVAPDAEWIHAAVIDRVNIDTTVADAIAAFEWVVNPSGDPSMGIDVPHACSNSWGLLTIHGYPNCDDLFWEFIDNAEAVGVVTIFAAGNEGASGLRRPADRATDSYRNHAVGALDPHQPSLPLAGFSSQGPTNCTEDGSSATKPNISAPGVSIRSSVSGGGYGQLSGTSMAAPHIAGAVALIQEACDQLSVDEIKQILYDTAIDLGSEGKNNQYGWGMVDTLAAVQLAEDLCIPSIHLPEGLPPAIGEGEAVSISMEISAGNEQPVPGTEKFFYRMNDGSFVEGTLEEVGELQYEAHLPAPSCDDEPQFYFQVEGDQGAFVTKPDGAPDEFFSVPVGTVVESVAYEQSFAAGVPEGWELETLWHVSGDCSTPNECAGEQVLYFGDSDTCTLDGDEEPSGFAFGETIEVPEQLPDHEIILSFCHDLDLPVSDRAYFYINGSLKKSFDPTDAWETFELDISEFAGSEIVPSWRVILNPNTDPADWEGWQIDQIQITAADVVCDDDSCPADFTGSGAVDILDLLQLLDAWGECEDCAEDLTGNGEVDLPDLLILLDQWGPCP